MGELIPLHRTYTAAERDQLESDLSLREVNFRTIGTLSVWMYYHKKSGSVSISIQAPDANWAYIVEEHEAADAFMHPYPYGFRRGLELKPNE